MTFNDCPAPEPGDTGTVRNGALRTFTAANFEASFDQGPFFAQVFVRFWTPRRHGPLRTVDNICIEVSRIFYLVSRLPLLMCAQCCLPMYTSRQFCYHCGVQRHLPNRPPRLTYEVMPGYVLANQIGLTEPFYLVPFDPQERLQQQLDEENAAKREAEAEASSKDKGKGKNKASPAKDSEDEFTRELYKQLDARIAQRLAQKAAGALAEGHIEGPAEGPTDGLAEGAAEGPADSPEETILINTPNVYYRFTNLARAGMLLLINIQVKDTKTYYQRLLAMYHVKGHTDQVDIQHRKFKRNRPRGPFAPPKSKLGRLSPPSEDMPRPPMHQRSCI